MKAVSPLCRPVSEVAPVPQTMRVYAWGLLLLYALMLVVGCLMSPDILSDRMYPDFLAFYTATSMGDGGDLALAYDQVAMAEAQAPFVGQNYYPWYYPPTFATLLSWMPALGYAGAYAAFQIGTAALFALAMRPLVTDRTDWLLLAAMPVLFINALHGQNGFLTAALAAFAVRWLPRSEVRAGLALGVLTIKPHLGLLMPVVLLAYRRWTTIATAIGTALGLGLLSVALYGTEPWTAFLAAGPGAASDDIAASVLPTSLTPSPYAALLLMGAPMPLAAAVHATFVAAIIAVLVLLIRSDTPYRFVVAVLLAAAPMASPHGFLYDWVILAVPMAVLWRDGRAAGFLRWEREGLVAVYILPIVIQGMKDVGVPVALPVVALLLVLTLRRAVAMARRTETGRSPPSARCPT